MFAGIIEILYILQRRLIKWLLNYITGSCELLRIVNSKEPDLNKLINIQTSLKLSRNTLLQGYYTRIKDSSVDYFSKEVAIIKHIKPLAHHDFQRTFRPLLTRLYSYECLCEEVEAMRTTKYSETLHQQLLLDLWDNLKPNTPLTSLKSKLWQDVGFQGDDPATDFRGMGMLALKSLLHLTSNHKRASQQLFSHSLHPQYGYFFAIVGINLTSLTYSLLSKHHLKALFFSRPHLPCSLHTFYEVFVHLYVQFDSFWVHSKPPSIMYFEEYKGKFEGIVLKQLEEQTFMVE